MFQNIKGIGYFHQLKLVIKLKFYVTISKGKLYISRVYDCNTHLLSMILSALGLNLHNFVLGFY